jgi:hypothetical protein
MDYKIRLGQLVSIWTPHISNGEHGTLAVAHAPLFTSIFPERDRSCHFMIQENSDEGTQARKPLHFEEGEALTGLMTLKSFMDGGFEVTNVRLLVCVKGVGAKKKSMLVINRDVFVLTNIKLRLRKERRVTASR